MCVCNTRTQQKIPTGMQVSAGINIKKMLKTEKHSLLFDRIWLAQIAFVLYSVHKLFSFVLRPVTRVFFFFPSLLFKFICSFASLVFPQASPGVNHAVGFFFSF